MNILAWSLVGIGAFLFVYAAVVLALVIAGRRESARALAGFIPDQLLPAVRLQGGAGWLAVQAPEEDADEPPLGSR
jgi:hypothetical protein